ncbi:MAG: hypothetical protein ACJ735_01030 [Actinomycetes bacterium]
MLLGCGSNGVPDHEATKAPNEVLSDASKALRGAQSYRVTGTLDPGFSVNLVVVPTGSRGTVTVHGVTWNEVTVGGRTWFRGAKLWQATVSKARAAAYDDHWVLVRRPRAAFGFAGRIAHLHESIPGVVFGPQQGLSNTGARKLNRERVVELVSDSDIYDVQASDPHYPVRWLEKENPGPDGSPCGITIDAFNQPVTVPPPKTTLELTSG